MPRVQLTAETKQRIKSQSPSLSEEEAARLRAIRAQIAEANQQEILRQIREKEIVFGMELAACLAADWAYAQEQLTGKAPDPEDMPDNYSSIDYIKDRLARLECKDASVADLHWCAIDCCETFVEIKGESRPAIGWLSPWHQRFMVDIQHLKAERLSEKQVACIKRIVERFAERVGVNVSVN